MLLNVDRFVYRPVTTHTLPDLAAFSESHGKFRYCSCMRWRLRSSEFSRSTKEERVGALQDLVKKEIPVGVLAYADGKPVGWCSVAPRQTYAGLERSAALARVDQEAVWSVVCFFVDSGYRRQGVARGLLTAAVEYAREQGAAIVEGYPVEPGSRVYTFMGSPSIFLEAGFHDVTLPGRERRVMRYAVE